MLAVRESLMSRPNDQRFWFSHQSKWDVDGPSAPQCSLKQCCKHTRTYTCFCHCLIAEPKIFLHHAASYLIFLTCINVKKKMHNRNSPSLYKQMLAFPGPLLDWGSFGSFNIRHLQSNVRFLRELSAADSLCGCVYMMVSAGCCCVNAAGVVHPLNSGSYSIKWLMRVLIGRHYHQDWLVLISDVSSNWFHRNGSCVVITWTSYELQFLQPLMAIASSLSSSSNAPHIVLIFVWQQTPSPSLWLLYDEIFV